MGSDTISHPGRTNIVSDPIYFLPFIFCIFCVSDPIYFFFYFCGIFRELETAVSVCRSSPANRMLSDELAQG